jgi:hypothetical protein
MHQSWRSELHDPFTMHPVSVALATHSMQSTRTWQARQQLSSNCAISTSKAPTTSCMSDVTLRHAYPPFALAHILTYRQTPAPIGLPAVRSALGRVEAGNGPSH